MLGALQTDCPVWFLPTYRQGITAPKCPFEDYFLNQVLINMFKREPTSLRSRVISWFASLPTSKSLLDWLLHISSWHPLSLLAWKSLTHPHNCKSVSSKLVPSSFQQIKSFSSHNDCSLALNPTYSKSIPLNQFRCQNQLPLTHIFSFPCI